MRQNFIIHLEKVIDFYENNRNNQKLFDFIIGYWESLKALKDLKLEYIQNFNEINRINFLTALLYGFNVVNLNFDGILRIKGYSTKEIEDIRTIRKKNFGAQKVKNNIGFLGSGNNRESGIIGSILSNIKFLWNNEVILFLFELLQRAKIDTNFQYNGNVNRKVIYDILKERFENYSPITVDTLNKRITLFNGLQKPFPPKNYEEDFEFSLEFYIRDYPDEYREIVIENRSGFLK